MAKIIEETVIIKISKIVKDGDDYEVVADEMFIAGIEDMASQLVTDPRAIVEVTGGGISE